MLSSQPYGVLDFATEGVSTTRHERTVEPVHPQTGTWVSSVRVVAPRHVANSHANDTDVREPVCRKSEIRVHAETYTGSTQAGIQLDVPAVLGSCEALQRGAADRCSLGPQRVDSKDRQGHAHRVCLDFKKPRDVVVVERHKTLRDAVERPEVRRSPWRGRGRNGGRVQVVSEDVRGAVVHRG